MKKLVVLYGIFLIVIGIFSTASASTVELYLDTAPNASGSPAYAAFRAAAFQRIYDDSFVNQTNSNDSGNVGTLNYDAADYLVYSFGDLGKRLHSFYYIEGETVAALNGRFEVSILYADQGVWYNPYVQYGWGEWVQPSSWIDYDGNGDGVIDGVMGTMGNALWGAYGYTSDTPEARAALASDLQYVENWVGDTRFFAKLDGEVTELRALHTASAIPEPTTLLLLGFGLLGVARVSRRKN